MPPLRGLAFWEDGCYKYDAPTALKRFQRRSFKSSGKLISHRTTLHNAGKSSIEHLRRNRPISRKKGVPRPVVRKRNRRLNPPAPIEYSSQMITGLPPVARIKNATMSNIGHSTKRETNATNLIPNSNAF